MNKLSVHIISFDIPYPANYGGVIDVFYKIKSLKEIGIEVILHTFKYGREESVILEELCKKVYYYSRKINKKLFFSDLPYIVSSRTDSYLLENLLEDNCPIIFEGLHSTFLLKNEKLKHRFKIVRTHNIEHDYYLNLGKVEKRIFKKIYYYLESYKLKSYESILKKADIIFAISKNDKLYFEKKYKNVELISAFHPNDIITNISTKEKFALYHANLSVGENNFAAIYLVNEVFSKLNIPFIIAGNNPSKKLLNLCKKYSHIEIRSDLDTDDILNLISEAHINILPTFQPTGIKLKLLSALYRGKWCIVNSPMIINTGLEELCIIKDKPCDMIIAIKKYYNLEFDNIQLEKRQEILSTFDNIYNAKKIKTIIENAQHL